MSSLPVLTYFDLYGKGEAIRMAFSHAKVEFEDNRVGGESWLAFKSSGKCANGQVPVLEVGDQCMNQSEAILRFVGKQTGAYPQNPVEAWFADSIINTCSDYDQKCPKLENGSPIFYALFGDTPLPQAQLDQWVAHRKTQMEQLAKLLGDRDCFGGDIISIADFYVTANLYSFERNTQGNQHQAHVYKALNEALNEKMATYADNMGDLLKDYLANRKPGSL